jgi:spore coat protein U-like protein
MRSINASLVASLACAGALVAGSGAASAGTTTTFLVSATVNKNCSIAAAPLPFGTYTPGGGVLAVNGSVNVNCTKSTGFTLALNAGTTTGDAFTQRLLQNTTSGDTDTLQYNLYTSNTYGTVWGDGTGSTKTVTGTGTGMSNTVVVPVYGQLVDSAANQNVSPGTYTDTITVTVTF